MTGDKKKPDLDRDDLDLWRQVTENLKPLPDKARNRNPADLPEKARAPTPNTAPLRPVKKTPISERAVPPEVIPPPPKPAAMETRRIRKLARGITSFDAKIDLHGMTQKEAHARLMMFLREAKNRGNRNVLVVTGKGRAGAREPEPGREAPGVIRRNIRHWLNEPVFAELVAAWSPARQHHGGDGAIYIQVRRARD